MLYYEFGTARKEGSLHRVDWATIETPSGPVYVPSGPIILDDAKKYARITVGSEDFLAEDMLAGAIEAAETATRRTITLSLWDLVLDRFSACRWIELRKPPVVAIQEVSYRDTDDAWQVIDPAEYTVELDGDNARVGPLYGESWPSVSSLSRSVRVRYRAGYRPHDYVVVEDVATPPLLPANLKTGICELFAHRFDTRGLDVPEPGSINSLFWSERVDL